MYIYIHKDIPPFQAPNLCPSIADQDLTVLLQPVLRVYRLQLKEAWKATGFVKLQKVAILG